jgi:hypothetical protein
VVQVKYHKWTLLMNRYGFKFDRAGGSDDSLRNGK